MIESIDLYLFHAINHLAGHNKWLDLSIDGVSRSYLVKGIPVMLVWWGLWFAHDQSDKTRARLLAVLVTAIGAIFAGRMLALFLPFRFRPLHHPELAASMPIGLPELMLAGWSSMPSDHAMLFFALAVGLYSVHKLAGMILVAHAVFVICLPRIYLGLHYPSDIVVGAVVGIVLALVLVGPLSGALERRQVMRLAESHGALFYPAIFLITFQTASMFESAREVLKFALATSSHFFG